MIMFHINSGTTQRPGLPGHCVNTHIGTDFLASLANLTCFNAGSADANTFGATCYLHPYVLQIRHPAALGMAHGITDIMPG